MNGFMLDEPARAAQEKAPREVEPEYRRRMDRDEIHAAARIRLPASIIRWTATAPKPARRLPG
jgi:hypothetical protein